MTLAEEMSETWNLLAKPLMLTSCSLHLLAVTLQFRHLITSNTSFTQNQEQVTEVWLAGDHRQPQTRILTLDCLLWTAAAFSLLSPTQAFTHQLPAIILQKEKNRSSSNPRLKVVCVFVSGLQTRCVIKGNIQCVYVHNINTQQLHVSSVNGPADLLSLDIKGLRWVSSFAQIRPKQNKIELVLLNKNVEMNRKITDFTRLY